LKNLVYVFAGIIILAFSAMMFITYTEQDMNDFLKYKPNTAVKEVNFSINPIFEFLQNQLDLPKYELIREKDISP
jgi:hypothetical protein